MRHFDCINQIEVNGNDDAAGRIVSVWNFQILNKIIQILKIAVEFEWVECGSWPIPNLNLTAVMRKRDTQ